MSGNRRAIPATGTTACASCGESRGKRRQGWTPVHVTGPDGSEQIAAFTCPKCPMWDEPIRYEKSKSDRVRFLARVDATPAGSRERRQASKRCDTLEGARAYVEQVRAEVARAGRFAPAEAETVRELCDRWLATRHDIRAVTRDGYRSALIAPLRHIGDRPAREVTRPEMRALVARLAADGGKRGQALSPRTVRAALIALGQAFAFAVEDGLIAVSPVEGVKPPRVKEVKGTEVQHWTPEEMRTFRNYSDADALAGAWRLTLSGLTRADIMGLRWSDVNLDAGTVTIAQGRVALMRGDATDTPKSAQRRRTVALDATHPGTVAMLRRLHVQQANDRLAAGSAWNASGYVVVDALGTPLRPEFYSDRFQALCREAGVPVIRLHSVRHSLAFLLHSAGVLPTEAARLLGHTVAVHLATYLPEARAEETARASAAIAAAMGAAS
ncbi:site-specific integrase [Demequina subtropica]|uniref:site-specific integrase n=1 Tax=Demequina subtropica TaxID=1638989 RepID=UPI000A64D95E|nr:tyrosine-type recombinase/integrase [Demequina subtropica]